MYNYKVFVKQRIKEVVYVIGAVISVIVLGVLFSWVLNKYNPIDDKTRTIVDEIEIQELCEYIESEKKLIHESQQK